MPRPAILILTHGELADALLASARTIVGDLRGIHALSLPWEDDREAAGAKLEGYLSALDLGAGLLVLTDIYGGTPFNVASELEVEPLEVVSGVNLPMVVRLGCGTAAGRDVHELADWIVDKSRGGICRSRSLAERVEPDPCEEPGDRA